MFNTKCLSVIEGVSIIAQFIEEPFIRESSEQSKGSQGPILTSDPVLVFRASPLSQPDGDGGIY